MKIKAVLALSGMMALLCLAPLLIYPIFLMKVLCFALFAMAFNLLVGYVGLLSFGHAMFFGSAAYVCGHAVKVLGWPPEVAILAGAGTAAALGAFVGLVAIRRQGIYFAMVTLALAQMVYFFCLQAKFTGGEDGIQRIPRGTMFGVLDISNDTVLFYVVLAIVTLAAFLIYRVIYSPFGQVLRAIRENEARAISLGYEVNRYKLLAFVLSAALSGLAGAMKSVVFQLASLADVAWQMSGEVILMTLVGGLGTVFGPAVGAAVIVAVQNQLAGFGEWILLIQGAIFVVTVLVFRRGIVGEAVALAKRVASRQRGAATTEKSEIAPAIQCIR